MMINSTEHEERDHLETIKEKLDAAADRLGLRAWNYAREAKEQKKRIWEDRTDMDHVEKASLRQSVDQTLFNGSAVLAGRNRLQRLRQSPYFGRFDFRRKGTDSERLPVYVGLHSFVDETKKQHLIFDWRAPIATMFYDHEIGPAHYDSPSGRIAGDILLKRQYRIRDGRMEFMLESGLHIGDEVLQEELSRASDDRMKTIVATIQRDQNAIIRNEDAQVLIIQGVAGSGKTSIALHRVAFLLYRFKESLTAQDILIISPNKVFADFIANVLPELGEEQIAEKEMETLAGELLESKYSLQTFFEQTALLLEKDDAALQERIREKSSLDFLQQLDAYIEHFQNRRFRPQTLTIGRHQVADQFIVETYNKRLGLPIAERLRWVAEVIERDVWNANGDEMTAEERAKLRAGLRKMYRRAAMRTIYKEFFAWMGAPHLFKPGRKAQLEYADVFPLLYLQLKLEGVSNHLRRVKHLVIDEMQDYTPVQYAVLAHLFPCEKTILGDVHQSVNPFSSSTAAMIQRIFRQAECVQLCKSYRSSYEITRFAQRISPNADLIAIERHGDKPDIVRCRNSKEEQAAVLRSVREFSSRNYRTLGIICKTQRQAAELYHRLGEEVPEAVLLDAQSTSFVQGIVLCSAHLAKGLEFDQVHVPFADNNNYRTEMDRNLLYVACTRALHKLTLTCIGTPTPFVAT